ERLQAAIVSRFYEAFMASDLWSDWVLRPLTLAILAGALLILGMMVGSWSARRRQARRNRTPDQVEEGATAPAPTRASAAREDFTSTSKASAREWDDGPPRPNWNRQISHYWPRPKSKQPRQLQP